MNVAILSFGYLHRIPSQFTDRNTLAALHEHSDLEDQPLFAPADVSMTSVTTSSSSPTVAHPHPMRAREATRRTIDQVLARDAQSTSRPSTPRHSAYTPGPSSQPPVTSRSFGSLLNGDSPPQS